VAREAQLEGKLAQARGVARKRHRGQQPQPHEIAAQCQPGLLSEHARQMKGRHVERLGQPGEAQRLAKAASQDGPGAIGQVAMLLVATPRGRRGPLGGRAVPNGAHQLEGVLFDRQRLVAGREPARQIDVLQRASRGAQADPRRGWLWRQLAKQGGVERDAEAPVPDPERMRRRVACAGREEHDLPGIDHGAHTLAVHHEGTLVHEGEGRPRVVTLAAQRGVVAQAVPGGDLEQRARQACRDGDAGAVGSVSGRRSQGSWLGPRRRRLQRLGCLAHPALSGRREGSCPQACDEPAFRGDATPLSLNGDPLLFR